MDADTIGMIVVLCLVGLMVVGLGIGGFLVVRDTMRGSGRWGVNLRHPICKKCRTPAPTVRVPKTTNEMLWGGWTCAECGLELDKWGEPLPNQSKPAKWKAVEAMDAAEEPKPKRRAPRDDKYRRDRDA